MQHYTQKTIELFKKVSDKPSLNQKILARPSFKFFQLIVLETTKKTQFLAGLFTQQEENPNRPYSKTQKIEFYRKIINSMEFIKKRHLDILPYMMVEGLCPDKTNYVLQDLVESAINKVKSADIVNKVLKGQIFKQPPRAIAKPYPVSAIFSQQEVNWSKISQQKENNKRKGIQKLKDIRGVVFARYKVQLLKSFFRQLKHAKDLAEHKRQKESSCKVCLQGPLQMINLTCFHYSVCSNCSEYLKQICPICRAEGQFKRVFKA